MNRRWLAATLASALLISGVSAFWISMPQTPTSPSVAPFSPRTGKDVLSADAARTLEADLSSSDKRRVRQALAIPDGQKLDSKFYAGMAALGAFTIREETAVQLDDDSARVYADVEHGRMRTWTMLLTRTGNRWLVASTIEGEQR